MAKSLEQQRTDSDLAYCWVSYMMSHEPKEIKRLLKYGTPSERLIALANKKISIVLNGKAKMVMFPISLSKLAGQKLIFKVATRVTAYVKSIPIQAFNTWKEVQDTITHRRKDTLSNILMVAESILHRAASEFKHEVLFAFDSINVWIKAVYKKELGYVTIRKALEILETTGLFKVVAWGVRGDRSKATKIRFFPLPRKELLTYTSDLDEWLMFNDHAITKVYTRESFTRQDVLEERIHYYAEQLADEQIMSGPGPVRKLFPNKTSVTVKEIEITLVETGVWSDEYLDRLLGRMVQPLQAHGSNPG